MALIGAAAATKGAAYHVGTLVRMGPGFIPVVLGTLLALLGALIAVSSGTDPQELDTRGSQAPDWRRRAAILGGPVLFVVFARFGGMIPATFACVLVPALGDRSSTWTSAILLAGGVTLFGAILFGLVLRVPLPIFQWD